MANNSMQRLSEKLSEKAAEDAARLESQTQIALKSHVSALNQLSTDALREMRAAIERESGAMEAALESHRSAMQRMALELKMMHEAEAKRMRWILRGPLVLVVVVTMVAMVGIWAWWNYQRPWQTVRMDNGEVYQVLRRGEWTTTCTVQGIRRPCRPATGGNN